MDLRGCEGHLVESQTIGWYKQLRSQKWENDEYVAYWIELILFILFYPVFMLLKVRKLHFASIFNTPISRRLQENVYRKECN